MSHSVIKLSLALGGRVNPEKGLTLGVTKQIQLCIHHFLQMDRSMSATHHTETEVTVQHHIYVILM